jgi:hypothetical protein
MKWAVYIFIALAHLAGTTVRCLHAHLYLILDGHFVLAIPLVLRPYYPLIGIVSVYTLDHGAKQKRFPCLSGVCSPHEHVITRFCYVQSRRSPGTSLTPTFLLASTATLTPWSSFS